MNGAINQPKSLQAPHPPTVDRRRGEKKALRVVAKYADYANFAGTLELFTAKSRIDDNAQTPSAGIPPNRTDDPHVRDRGVDQKAWRRRSIAPRCRSGRSHRKVPCEFRDRRNFGRRWPKKISAFRDAGAVHLIGCFADAVTEGLAGIRGRSSASTSMGIRHQASGISQTSSTLSVRTDGAASCKLRA